ncbi:hypothetical protein [Paraburkholderia sp. 32]|uniref:hypothetical protein n=1 Tax=Paraburkholderia sp. 32 TaxID=2991057 RepID=UPI003D22C845
MENFVEQRFEIEGRFHAGLRALSVRKASAVLRPTSGNVGVNNTIMHGALEDLPFGGIGPSGMGAYHGIEGFRAMSHAEGVFVQGRWSAAQLLHAPFWKLANFALNMNVTKAAQAARRRKNQARIAQVMLRSFAVRCRCNGRRSSSIQLRCAHVCS